MHAPGGSIPGGGVITSQSPPFAVPIRYMLLGIVCFGLFAIDLAIQSSSMATGDPGAPNIVAVTHMLTLGALLAFVMGAVYQLTTVAFLIPIASVPAARWNFWVYLVGLVGLFCSMQWWWAAGFLVFGSLMVASIYTYAGVMIVSLRKTTVRGPMFGFVVSAHAYLILAVSVALLLVLDDSGAVPSLDHWMGELIATHILLAVGGFFTFLVMGFSFKLLPMFTLSHGFPTHRQKWTLIHAHGALWVLLTGIWTHLTALLWIGAVLGVISLISQLIDVRGILKKRMRKKIEPPIRAVVTAVGVGILGIGLMMAQLVWKHEDAGWQGVVLFYLLGAVTLTVIGFAYKIVPFLVWSKRHSERTAERNPVLISDLIDINQSRPVLMAFGTGVWILAAGSLALWRPAVISGAVLIALAIVTFCIQVLKVVDPKQVARELAGRD